MIRTVGAKKQTYLERLGSDFSYSQEILQLRVGIYVMNVEVVYGLQGQAPEVPCWLPVVGRVVLS